MKNLNAKEWTDLYVKEVISKYNKKFQVRPKSESKLLKFLNPIIRRFNPDFDRFAIVLFGTLWVPDDFFKVANPLKVLMTLAHEGLHERTRSKLPPLVFELLYTMPQSFAMVFLLLCFMHSWWWAIAMVVSLLPLPSPRYLIEMEGYSTRKLWSDLGLSKYHPEVFKEATIYNMTNIKGGYYIPMFLKRVVEKRYNKPLNLDHEKYRDIVEFLKRHEVITH